jgi:hypothetical protein
MIGAQKKNAQNTVSPGRFLESKQALRRKNIAKRNRKGDKADDKTKRQSRVEERTQANPNEKQNKGNGN